MNITELVLIEILRCFVADAPQKLNIDNADKDKLFKLAKKHSVIGIVAYVLNKYDLYENEEQKRKFMHEYDRTVMNMVSREASAVKLLKKLEGLSVKHILFKGLAVASAYPVSALRAYGDVDILIRKEDVKSVCDFMVSEGFRHSVADEGVVNVFVKNKEHYEFHTNLNVSNVKDCHYFSEFWDNTTEYEGTTRIFKHDFHLVYLITHLEKHVYGSGAGLRMYLDIALYLKKYKDCINIEEVRDVLNSCDMGSFFNTVLFVVEKWFGVTVSSQVTPLSDDVYAQMCSFTVSGGVFGNTSTEQQAEDSLRRSMENGRKNARFRFLMRRVFPRFSELSRLYPRYAGKPYLAPVAWITHLFSFFRNRKYDRVKVITSANVDDAVKKKEFLESIGCVR